MSGTLHPQLRQRLVEAAAAERGRRTRRSTLGAALAAVCIAVAVLASVLAGREAPTTVGQLPQVPAETLTKAGKYASSEPAADERSRLLDQAGLDRFARALLEVLPYPPGRSDDALLALTAKLGSARDMSQVSVAADLRSMGEFRAACTWQQLWVQAHDSGNETVLRAATTVLATVPRWPNSSGDFSKDIAAAARDQNAALINRYAEINCDTIGG